MRETIETDRRSYRRRARKRSRGREALSWVICIVGAVAVALLLRAFVFELVTVDGESMEPTLHSYQNLFVEKVSRYSGNIERGQIIIVNYPGEDGVFVKRVVGLPGDTLEVRDGSLYVNGERREEPYILDQEMDYEMEKTTVPADSYFVLGDNRNDSLDSHLIGSIPQDMVRGHALFIIWPLSDIGSIESTGS